ncbi:hypothetical protein [Streptomyces sp. I05A-00742]|uniref:hypothetical protein n=1 Tax=Streptomyces sp. I05A-00742 TaxID=2732853 RepID=UPI001488B600|nr:hypothetical protein [Streptomyces sp. I05A-00742]
MDRNVAIGLLRMAAAHRDAEVWLRPSGEQLVRLGLDALLAGVEAPSLFQLAGLGRNEYGEARELFGRALEELELLPLLPEELADARWTVARWWARRIVEGDLEPFAGALLIWEEAAAELGHPAELRRIVELSRAVETRYEEDPIPRHIRGDIISAARDFLREA